MRIARGNHRNRALHNVRIFVMVLATATASLFLHKSLTHGAAAEPEQKPVDGKIAAPERPQTTATTTTTLQTGKPQSTTPTDVKSSAAMLTWTPTGAQDVQDTYNVRIATDATPDPLTGQLSTDVVKTSDVPLTSATFDATDLPEGTYYWQVESCAAAAPLLCNGWSDVWTLHVDNTPPADPTAEYTSERYSQTVSFAGAAEALATVAVNANDKSCTATAAADGTWSCTFPDEFAYGDYTATVTATDKAGNQSTAVPIDFSVKELFVAPVISVEALPPVLDVVPVDPTPENQTVQPPQIAKIDTVHMAPITTTAIMPAVDDAPVTVKPLSTDGGIIQSSENGWQIFGLPWFLWIGGGAGIAGAMWAFGVPIPRRLTTLLSL